MNLQDQMTQAMDSPREFEALYRKQPKEFRRLFPQLFAARPESPVLATWDQRLFFDHEDAATPSIQMGEWKAADILLTLVLSLIGGSLLKLLSNSRGFEEIVTGAHACGIVSGTLIAFFAIQTRLSLRVILTISSILIASLVYLSFLPTGTDTSQLATLHMVFIFWVLVGVAFVGGASRDSAGTMNYIRYSGELLIYFSVIAIGGGLLMGLTIGLFEILGMDIGKWYIENIIPYGVIGALIVASLFVTRIVVERFRIAPLLAKAFTPLFLLMVAGFLAAMVVQQQSPYEDRDFLLTFNILLLVVLGLCVFSVSERGSKDSGSVGDLLNISLVSITLIVDLIALSAILYRLSEYGFSPNRVAVLGANLLVFGHLAGILYHYVRFVRQRTGSESLKNWIASFLSVYCGWCLFVAIGLPIIFAYE